MPHPRDPYEILARAIAGCPVPERDVDGAPSATRGPKPVAPRHRRTALRLLRGGNAGPERAPHPDGPRPALVLVR